VQQQNHLACPCGSLLSRARCCGVDVAALARPSPNALSGASDPQRHLVPLEQRAAEARRLGDTETATALVLDVLELSPGRPRALALLYEIRKEAGALPAAEALIHRLVTLEPNNFWATNEIGLLLLGRGAVAEAERHARNAMRIAPDSAQAHYVLGLVLTENHRPAFAEFHYRRALDLSGSRDPAVLSNLALCLKNQGKMAAARALYTESLAAAPAVLHTLLGFARLEEADRNLDAALALLDRAETVAPDHPSVLLLRAVVLGRKGEAGDALTLLARIEAGPHALGASEFLEKGRLLDKIGRYEEAFTAYDAGKAKLREASSMAYLDAHAAHEIARRQGFFTRQRLATLPRAGIRTDVAQPIFIVGFPRSGTTLLEQTLTAHPRIAAGDELPFVHEITQLMPRMLDSPLGYPEALAELWMADHRDDLDNLRDHYLRKVAQLGIVPPGAAWFTDKMPLNETDLGLIALLFPRAPLIHVVRHPLDVVLSVYSNLLTHGHYCAYALETIAQHYVRIAELVAQYRREMDLHYLALRYEDMVTDQAKTVRAALDFIGADFDPACLDFHENRRYARTASYAQVSEKLYDRSLYRYKKYIAQLQPVIPILQPVMDRLGYVV
jgi:tetratricopeptide (TPR) repeat protein